MIKNHQSEQAIKLTLLPNRSASWLASKRMIAIMFGVVMTIAFGWFYVGVWMILPFAGLEIGLFATLMYLVSKQTYRQQIVTLLDRQIIIENKLGNRRIVRTLDRQQSFIEIIETERDWHLPKVYVVDDQQRIQIGDFLNLQDRHELREHLKLAGIPTCRTHWWKSEN